MSFCSSCGGALKDGVRFCSVCGASVAMGESNLLWQQQMIPNEMNNLVATRNQSLNEIQKMINYFSNIQNLYDEYDYTQNQIRYWRKYKKTIFFVFGIVSCVALEFLFFALYGAVILYISAYKIALFLFPVIFCIILIVLLIPVPVILFRQFAKSRGVGKAKAEQYVNRSYEIAAEINDYYVNYGPCAVGVDYTYPNILIQLADVIRIGRADTIKEAINIMIDDEHKAQMESLAIATAEAAQRAANSAADAALFAAWR